MAAVLFGFQMVLNKMNVILFGFRMVISFRMVLNKMAAVLFGFRIVLFGFQMVRTIRNGTFQNRTLKCLVLGWHLVFRVRYSSPNCTAKLEIRVNLNMAFRSGLFTSWNMIDLQLHSGLEIWNLQTKHDTITKRIKSQNSRVFWMVRTKQKWSC